MKRKKKSLVEDSGPTDLGRGRTMGKSDLAVSSEWEYNTYFYKYGRPEIRRNKVLGTAPVGVSGNSEIKWMVIRHGSPTVGGTPGRSVTSSGSAGAEQK